MSKLKIHSGQGDVCRAFLTDGQTPPQPGYVYGLKLWDVDTSSFFRVQSVEGTEVLLKHIGTTNLSGNSAPGLLPPLAGRVLELQ